MGISSTANFTFRRNLELIPQNTNSAAFYMFAAKSTPWPNDAIPPQPDNSVSSTEYQISREILFGKNIGNSGISLMTTRHDWVSGTVYTQYDESDPNLFTENFYVLTLESGNYHVFKCMYNNNGSPSTSQPKLAETSADDPVYITADGYQWKYLYSFSQSTYSTFADSSFIPVVANNSVTANAIPGSLFTYIVQQGGQNYNSFTNGYFTDINVGGNTMFFGIQGSDSTIISASPNTYNLGETITQTYSGTVASGIVSAQLSNSTVTFITLKNVSNQFVVGANTIVGGSSAKTSTVLDVSSPDVSSNSNFYNQCSIYISSGTGAGQLNTIEEYVVTGTARRVLLANNFSIQPDLTSKYIISPRVIVSGDGTGAQAISIVNSATKGIQSILPIQGGMNYTFANVSVVGNTGSNTLISNNAVVRATIPPRGGHGANVYSELDSTYIGFSSTFSNTEGGHIPGTGCQYRRVGIFTNPLWANVTLNYSYTTLPTWPTDAGAYVVGSITGSNGEIVTHSSNNITLTGVNGLFTTNEVLTAYHANGVLVVNSSSNVVTTSIIGQQPAFDNRMLLTCPASSLSGSNTAFNVGQQIVQSVLGNDVGTAFVEELDFDGTFYYVYLTEIRGAFYSSDLLAPDYKYIYDIATRQNRLQVNLIKNPDLVPFTGELLSVNDMTPITRNSLQSETVRIILSLT